MAEKRVVDGIVDWLNEASTPFHAVQAAVKRLTAAGFTQLVEADAWALEKGGKYFFTRNETTIVAFAVGAQFDPLRAGCRSGFTIIGAHTDSPCPKLKPVSKLSKGGHLMLSVVGYGGGLWHTWFDRDLSLAGRVLVRAADGAKTESRLVHIARPILRIPNLAIHLQSDEERRGFGPNLQSHFPPVLASEVKAQLEAPPAAATGAAKDDDDAASSKKSPVAEHHHALLLRLLAEELQVAPEQIADFELQLVDTQPSTVGGALREFVFSGRLDNLCSSYQALTALVDSCHGGAAALATEPNVRLVALFDHEEIGSVSAQGAASSLMPEILQRVSQTLGYGAPDVHARVLRRSYIVSADMAHALHPNYADKHDPGLQPKMHGGLVIKHNVNQRYATNSVTAHVFRELGKGFAKVPVQEFAVRADSRCGSTIGPLVAGLTGVRTVDVGSPQWAMHSVRECMATSDVYHGYKHFKAVYEHFPTVAAQCAEMYDA